MMNGMGYRPFKITFLDINFYPYENIWGESNINLAMAILCVRLVAWCGEEEDNFVYVLVS